MKIIKDLVLAMLNATLILIMVCLFFGWQVSKTSERVAASLASNFQVMKPVTAELNALNIEVSALRGDLANLSNSSNTIVSQTAQSIQARVDEIQTDLTGIHDKMNNIKKAPEQLVKVAVTTATDDLNQILLGLSSCEKPDG